MAIITKRNDVLRIYGEAARSGWVLPCFCSENQTTTEAVLAAAAARGEALGIPDVPVILAITCQYSHRTQAANYTHTRRWDIGLRLFMDDIQALAGKGGPYEDLKVMVHLDHAQADDDAELLESDLSGYSSIMFDASKFPFEENIARTAAFMKERGDGIVVEGACDEIVDATGTERSVPTDGDRAELYRDRTGVDLIVANLGTEHRASGADLRYLQDNARAIKRRIGPRIVLHGASSVPKEQIAHLFDDGVCKVNIWTTLERDSSPALFEALLRSASAVIGAKRAEEFFEEGLLGREAPREGAASLAHYTTTFRQDIVFTEMVRIVGGYYDLWYR